MPINKNAFLRYRIIDSMLASGRKYSKQEILAKLKDDLDQSVSGDTFNLDLRVLRENFKAPIEFKQREGYYYADNSYRLVKHNWTKEEIAALDFAYEALNTLNNIELAEEAQAVLRRLTSSVKQEEAKPGKRIIYRPPSPEVKGLEWLPELYEAIEKEKAITIKYYKLQTNEVKTHTISPYILRQYNNLWYMVGWCATRELTLVFALDRIREINVANVSYYKDPTFDAEQYFKYSFGITHSHFEKPEKVVFSVRNKHAIYFLEANKLHHSQQTISGGDRVAIMQIEVIICIELAQAFLALGGSVVVRKPQSLIKMMIELNQDFRILSFNK